MEAQQQYAAAEMKALEMRLTKAQSEAEALRSQADQNGSAVQSRDMVIQPSKQSRALAIASNGLQEILSDQRRC